MLDDYVDELMTPDGPIETRLAHLNSLRQKYRAAEEEFKRIKDIHDSLQAALFEEMRERGMTGLPTTAAVFTCKETIYANVNDMPAFEEWARDQERYEELLKPAPEKRRLNEIVRDAIDAGEEVPPGVSWYPREYIAITTKSS